MRAPPAKGQGNKIDPAKADITLALSDALLQRILLALPEAARLPCGLVCHRWLRIVGRLHRTLRLLDWDFLECGRLPLRFPHLTDVDLTWACMRVTPKKQPIILALPQLLLPVYPIVTREDTPYSLEACIRTQQLTSEALDRGLEVLASGCPDLKRLRIVDVSNNHGPGGSFSEWEFVSANDKTGLRNGEKFVSGVERVGVRGNGDLDQQGAGKIMSNADEGFRKSLMDDADDSVKNVVASNADGGGVKAAPNGTDARVRNGTDSADNGGVLKIELPSGDDGDGVKTVMTKVGIEAGGVKMEGKNVVTKVRIEVEGVKTEGKNVATKVGIEIGGVNMEQGKNVAAKIGGVKTEEGELGKVVGGQGKGSKQGEAGLASLGRSCPLLQELEVHQCTDETVTALVACQNVQFLRLVGTVPGFSNCSFTDVGLTILANRCRRLVKLELSGCEASFAGIAAIGQCCLMLEELTLSSTGFQEGWVAALGYYECLKTLRLESCKYIDRRPGPVEHIQGCHTLERLQLVCCDLRDRVGFAALVTVCVNVRELEIQDCWGLDDESFALAGNCRKLRLLSLDGCSLVTAASLEAVALACKELQRLRVVYCSNIRDSEITPDFGNVVVMLKEFRWRPDTKSLLSSTTDIAQTGRWFFKKA